MSREHKLAKLKRGDIIEVAWFDIEVRKARVIRNYPERRLIYLRIRSSLIVPFKVLEAYDHPYRFKLI